MEQELNFKTLCQMTTNMLELPEGSLADKSRRQELQIPRMVVSVVSKMVDNTHFDIISSGIKRDRTLINYYMKMHKSNYRSFPKYRDMFNNPVPDVLGPTASQIANISDIMWTWGTGKYNHHTARNVRRLLPFQNVWFLDSLFDEIEEKGLR